MPALRTTDKSPGRPHIAALVAAFLLLQVLASPAKASGQSELPHPSPGSAASRPQSGAPGSADALAGQIAEAETAVARDPQSAPARFQLGALYERSGNLGQAIASFRQALRLNPRDTGTLEQLVTIYGARLDWPNARDCAAHWLELEPQNPRARLLKAWSEFAGQEIPEARQDIEAAIALDPKDPELKNARGLILTEEGSYGQAEAAWREIAETDRDYLPARLNLCLLYLEMGRLPDAQAMVRQLLVSHPHCQAVRSVAALVDARTGDFRQAALEAQSALKSNPEDPLAMVALALALRSQGLEAECAVKLTEALAAAPRSTFVINELAAELLAAGRCDQAARLAQQAVQLCPGDDRSRRILAQALARKGNWDGAVLLLQQVAARNPEDAALRCELASAQEKKGDLDGAERSYKHALRTDSASVRALVGLARLRIADHDAGNAVRLAEQAVALAPQNDEAHLTLAEAFFRTGKLDASMEECRFILASSPARARAACLAGQILYQQRQWSRAIPYLQDCAHSAAATVPDWLTLASAQERAGDRVAARSTLEVARVRFPQDPQIAPALERMSRQARGRL